MANYVASVIAIASAEVGYLEKKSNKDLNSKTANAGKSNYTKYGKWFGLNPAYWCAMFISWIFYKAFGTNEGKKVLGTYSASCETIRQKFKINKRYYTSNPKVGDIVFFSGSRHSGANHIAIIYQVKDNKIYTIEGNTSGANGVVDNGGGVSKKSYSIGNSKILGYGRPAYDVKKTVFYYKKYTGKSLKIDNVFKAIGAPYGSVSKRKPVAKKNGYSNYKGSSIQNLKLIALAKLGKLKK
jgi:hypothetical protein